MSRGSVSLGLPVSGIPPTTLGGVGVAVGGPPASGATWTTGEGVLVGTSGTCVTCIGISVAVGETGMVVGVLLGVFVEVFVGVLVGVSVGCSGGAGGTGVSVGV